MLTTPARRTPVDSTSIAAIGYSPCATLDVEFKSGAVYRYFTVPREAFDKLLASESKGGFLNRHIKPRYPFRRLE